jgi:galactose mutarotase-like enzyme
LNTAITNGTLTARINSLGAELTSLTDAAGREYIWEGEARFWGKHSPVLFPIVGTLKNDTYTHNGTQYHLPRHGFARDNEFRVKERQSDSVTFSFGYNDDTLKAYPFQFELDIKYTLKDNALHIDYIVHNKGNQTMPFSIGAHPAFALPLDIGNYALQFEKKELLVSHILKDSLIAPDTLTLPAKEGLLPLYYSLFKNDALIFVSLRSHSVALVENDRPIIKVAYENFPHLGIWTKENAPFICIEPWHGYSDTPTSNGNIADKEGIVLLRGHEQANFKMAITLLQ